MGTDGHGPPAAPGRRPRSDPPPLWRLSAEAVPGPPHARCTLDSSSRCRWGRSGVATDTDREGKRTRLNPQSAVSSQELSDWTADCLLLTAYLFFAGVSPTRV